MWPELRPHGWRLVLVLLAGALVSAFKSTLPKLIEMLFGAWVSQDARLSYMLPPLLAAAWILSSAFRYYHMYWMQFISELIAVNLRRRLMNKYLNLNLSFHQNFVRGAGGLISRMLNDINVIQGGFQKIADVVREPFVVVFMFGYLIYLDWRLTLFILAGGPIITAVLRTFARSVRKYSKHNQESMEDLTQILKESLDGTRIVQSFNLQDEMKSRFEGQAKTYLGTRSKIIAREEASGPISESLSSIVVALLLAYIGHEILSGRMKPDAFIGFVTALTLLSDSVKKVQGAFIRLQQSGVALERLHGILESNSVVPEAPEPRTFPLDWKEIEFRNVSFRYENTYVLRNLNLKIRRGEQVALVGSSGAGKSTLINLLPRFFDPTEGEVLIGGVPIQDMPLSELRANIALVTQDVFLFSDTIERNIWSGDFTKSGDDIESAARLANAHDFIEKQPEYYHTRVGDRGSRLSGGEKQRISIARAVFKNAPILVLDEATSALDSESELEVQKGLDSLMEGRTALVIAHRLSTIAKCDRILVMDKGEIVEQGNHDQLMAHKGAYHRFFQLQSRL
jgi:ATP-binding cassette subfamily B protein/subfamily B ATP-binding cassette protein MsbA